MNWRFRPGDRVLFRGRDTFAGNIVLDASDRGTRGEKVVIGSYGKGRAIIDAGDGDGLAADGCDHLAISDLILRGSGRKGGNNGSGILLTNACDIEIDRVEVSGFRLDGIGVDGVRKSANYSCPCS